MAGLIRVPAVTKHTSTIILVHGLGDSGEGWRWLADNWRSKRKFDQTAFIFPTAPSIPISLNMGMTMNGWYDVLGFEDNGGVDHDEPGITRSQKTLHSLIADEIKAGIPSNRIVLGGFSQGGAMSIMAGATCPTRLGGIFSLSGYLLMQHKFRDLVPTEDANKDTPIFMAYGTADPLVRPDLVAKSGQVLTEWGRTVQIKSYAGMGHAACPQEINDLEQYLLRQIPDVSGETGNEGVGSEKAVSGKADSEQPLSVKSEAEARDTTTGR